MRNMFWRNCGKELLEDTTVCFECGAAQVAGLDQNMNPQKSDS